MKVPACKVDKNSSSNVRLNKFICTVRTVHSKSWQIIAIIRQKTKNEPIPLK